MIKVGLDDFLVKHGKGALRALLDKAEEPEMVDADEIKQPGEAIDPSHEAKVFGDMSRIDGVSKLRYWRERFYFWRSGQFVEVRDEEMRATLLNHLDRRYFKIKRPHTSNVLEFVKAHNIIPSRTTAPYFVERDRMPAGWCTKHLLMTQNKILHLPSLFEGGNAVIDATPALFNTAACGCKFLGKGAPEPTLWLSFLRDLWGDDSESITALQMWFGYCLTADTSQQKMLCLFGPKRCGKGTIARVLTKLIGEFNVSNPSLSSLAGEFGLQPLVDKSLAIIADARISGRSDTAIVTERILNITGEDRVTVNRKNLPMLDIRLLTRFMLLSNEFPRIADASGSLVSRMIVLRLVRSWFGREDRELTDKLLEELPSILIWAIQGWKMLRDRGYLLEPESSADSRQEWSDISSPISAFLREHCEIGPECQVEVDALYDAYKRWCTDEQGRNHVEDKGVFGRNLRAAVTDIEKARPRSATGLRVQVYKGLRLK